MQTQGQVCLVETFRAGVGAFAMRANTLMKERTHMR